MWPASAGSVRNTQHFADLMWRAGSPEGYQPPAFAHNSNLAASGLPDTSPYPHRPPFADLQNLSSHMQNKGKLEADEGQQYMSDDLALRTYSHDSAKSARPGTPPAASAHHITHRYSDHGYQALLDPLLPVSDVQPFPSPSQHSAQHQSRLKPMPSFKAASHTLKQAQHDHSAESSDHSLPGLHVPLEPHERQLLSNLLHRSHSTRSQDRSSDHSHSSASTHHEGQMPLSRLHSLPRSLSDRRLTSDSVLLHDKGMLQEPSDLSR